MKLTPVLFVETLEPSLAFWVDRLGFQVVATVPDQGPLGFAILARDGAEVMLQTHASVAEDVPALAALPRGTSCGLFLEVDDFDAARRRLGDAPVLFPERTTFYGMREIGVREPGGHVVTIAARVAGGASA